MKVLVQAGGQPVGFAGDAILEIAFPQFGDVRARTVVSRSRARPTGRYPSWKMGRMLQWESHNELNAMRLLDATPNVLKFSDQPCVIRYRLGGKDFRHYPDTLVNTAKTKSFWEIKTAADARRPEIAARTRLLTELLPAKGYDYAVVLAEDLAREPRMRQARLVLKNGKAPLTFTQREYVRRLFLTVDSLPWQDVFDGRYAPLTRQQACRLVLEGALHLDLDEPFGPMTRLTPIAGSTVLSATGESNG